MHFLHIAFPRELVVGQRPLDVAGDHRPLTAEPSPTGRSPLKDGERRSALGHLRELDGPSGPDAHHLDLEATADRFRVLLQRGQRW